MRFLFGVHRVAPFALSLLLVSMGLVGANCGGGGEGDDDDSAGGDDDLCAGIEAVSGTDIDFEVFATGVDAPTHLTHAGDGTGRVFVVEQKGVVLEIDSDGEVEDWLDISSQVTGATDLSDERGTLSMAFHPNFRENGRFFVYYNRSTQEVVISEFTVDGDPLSDKPDASSERVVLSIAQPTWNHNGGQVVFGPDGYLYIGTGDGGGAGDTYGNGQRKDTLLAKILRIDVDSGTPYGIPSDNPFVGDGDHMAETWSWGMRNPWRITFDRLTDEMWIGDVGQNAWEEIDIGKAGHNYGWPETEGNHCYTSGCDTSAFEPAVWEYDRFDGISVIGGFVYRGCRMPDLHGYYFFSDWGFGGSPIWSLDWDGTTAEQGPVWNTGSGALVTSFGEDEQGELYLCDSSNSRILKIVPEAR